MTDYSKLSDFDINAAVAEIKFPGLKITNFAGEAVVWFGNLETRVVRYCNNPADAWPIITANKIDIIQDNGQGCALATASAIQMFQGDDVHIEQDVNPLRAAMIVFLMMNEGE